LSSMVAGWSVRRLVKTCLICPGNVNWASSFAPSSSFPLS
jgi:hypothetical protein